MTRAENLLEKLTIDQLLTQVDDSAGKRYWKSLEDELAEIRRRLERGEQQFQAHQLALDTVDRLQNERDQIFWRVKRMEQALKAIDALIVCAGVRMDGPPELRLISTGRQEALAMVRAALNQKEVGGTCSVCGHPQHEKTCTALLPDEMASVRGTYCQCSGATDD